MRISRRGSGTRRVRQPGGRPHQRQVRLSDEELVHVEAAAKAAGLSVPSYLVAAATRTESAPGLSVAQREAYATELFGTSRLLRRASENLNRFTKVAQGQGQLPPEVPAAAQAVQHYVETFGAIAAELDPRQRGNGEGGR